jgi:hypothetical protein
LLTISGTPSRHTLCVSGTSITIGVAHVLNALPGVVWHRSRREQQATRVAHPPLDVFAKQRLRLR